MSFLSTRYVDGARPWEVLRSHLNRYERLLGQLFKRRKRRRRYLPLSPQLARFQVLYDRSLQRRLELEIRNDIDLGTLGQVFISEHYRLDKLSRCSELLAFRDAVLAAGKKPLIIDGGGNVGFASRYFAENHPGCTVLCIEPDPGNAEQARRNNDLKQVIVLEAAIGSEASRGRIMNASAENNAFRIDRSDEGSIEILSINDLLARFGSPEYVPFIAKIDIEGFESELFSRNTEWIERFPLLVVELHDWMLPRSASTGPFLRAIAAQDRDFLYYDENVFSISNTLL
jgi:FkbM family methyltransferase